MGGVCSHHCATLTFLVMSLIYQAGRLWQYKLWSPRRNSFEISWYQSNSVEFPCWIMITSVYVNLHPQNKSWRLSYLLWEKSTIPICNRSSSSIIPFCVKIRQTLDNSETQPCYCNHLRVTISDHFQEVFAVKMFYFRTEIIRPWKRAVRINGVLVWHAGMRS